MIDTNGLGGAIQFTLLTPLASHKNSVTFGASYDYGSTSFQQSSQDAVFDSIRQVVGVTPYVLETNNSSANGAGDIQVQPGDHIPGIPRNNFKLRADWQATSKLSIGGTVVYSSSQYAQGDNNNQDSNGPVPGYTIFNLDARYYITDQLQIFGRFNNLFDRKYQTAGVLGANFFTGPNFSYNNAGVPSSMFSSPGAPFNFWIGLRYDFDRPAKPTHSDDAN